MPYKINLKKLKETRVLHNISAKEISSNRPTSIYRFEKKDEHELFNNNILLRYFSSLLEKGVDLNSLFYQDKSNE